MDHLILKIIFESFNSQTYFERAGLGGVLTVLELINEVIISRFELLLRHTNINFGVMIIGCSRCLVDQVVG